MQEVIQASFNVMKGARMPPLPLFLYACNHDYFRKEWILNVFYIVVKLVRVHLHVVLIYCLMILSETRDQTYGKKKIVIIL